MVVRPEHATLVEADGFLTGTVSEFIYAGSATRVLVTLGSGAVMNIQRRSEQALLPIGSHVRVRWDQGAPHYLAL